MTPEECIQKYKNITKEEAIKSFQDTLFFLSNIPQFCNDYDVVLAAIRNNGNFLFNASDELKNNFNIVITAVAQNGNLLKYASERLINNKIIVETAIKNNFSSLVYASEELRNDKALITFAISQNMHALEYASDKLKNDKELVFSVFKKLSISYIESQPLEITFFDLISQYPSIIKIAPNNLKNNKSFILKALKADNLLFIYAGQNIKKEIGNAEPIQYLESYFFNQKLEQTIPNKINNSKKNKI